MIEKICKYLGVSLSYFFAFDQCSQKDIKEQELMEKFKNLSFEQILILEQVINQFKTQ